MAGLGVARLRLGPPGGLDHPGPSPFRTVAQIRFAVVFERLGSPDRDFLNVTGGAVLVRARDPGVHHFTLSTASANPFRPDVYDRRPHDDGFVPLSTGQRMVAPGRADHRSADAQRRRARRRTYRGLP